MVLAQHAARCRWRAPARSKATVLAAVLSLITLLGLRADAKPARSRCAEADVALEAERFVEAELAARACLAFVPDERQVEVSLWRALAGQQRYSEALGRIDATLRRHQHDMDLLAWRIRMLAWRGSLDTAWSNSKQLDPGALEDPDTAQLVGDLAFWREDWQEAVRRYDHLLKIAPAHDHARKNRGLALKELGRDPLEDLNAACKTDPVACAARDAYEKKISRFQSIAQTSYSIIEDRPDGFKHRSLFSARLHGELRVGVENEIITRDFGAGHVVDVSLGGSISYRFGFGLLLRGSALGTVEPDYLPSYSFQIEPGFVFPGAGPTAYLMYWRIGFEDAGSHVLVPTVTQYVGDFMVYGRYFLGIEDTGDLTHAGLAKLLYFVNEAWTLNFGAGGGNRADYLEVVANDRDFSVVGLTGLAWDIHWRHRVSLDYVLRHEEGDDRVYRQHQLTAGYRARF